MANALIQPKDHFHYVLSCNLAIPLEIKICNLEGERGVKDVKALIEDPMLQFSGMYQSKQDRSDLFVECQLFDGGQPISLPSQTAHKAFTTKWSWNEWVTIPILLKDIPRTARLAMTVYDIYGPGKAVPVGGTTVSLFGKRGCLHRGFHDLKLWRDTVADGSGVDSTPGKLKNEDCEMARLRKLVKRYRHGLMADVDWMDRRVFREIEHVNEKEKKESNHMYLVIEFPHFHVKEEEYRVVHYERDIEPSAPVAMENPDLKIIFDPEWNMENLVEAKHHKLTFTTNRKGARRIIEPPPKHKVVLQNILNQPPLHPLAPKEKQAVWMYRYFLSQDGRALPKFIKSVSWTGGKESKTEVQEALDLLEQWQPLNAAEALELLNADFAEEKTHPAIRKYAVSRLQRVDSEELQFYLLQLVQAIRYDSPAPIAELTAVDEEGQLQLFVDDAQYNAPRTQVEQKLAEAMVEGTTLPGKLSAAQSEDLPTIEELDSDGEEEGEGPWTRIEEGSMDMASSSGSSATDKQYSSLASFLVDRACSSTRLANFFFWYLSIECEENNDPHIRERYTLVRRKFLENLLSSSKVKWRRRYRMLEQQQALVARLWDLHTQVKEFQGDREKKIDYLRKLVSSEGWTTFPTPVRLPLDPTYVVTGMDPDWAMVFKSNLYPIGLTFKTLTGDKYRVIFKHGDDLRQDELILQLLALMDRLLKREKLDLKLTPYKVLACSKSFGFVEYVDSTCGVADVLSKYRSIQNFFKTAPGETAPSGDVNPEVMDTYVRSCAGYCVITYLLSVGDRHFDNLLLTPSGKLLHIDFSYILGRDPKPFPPPMKLSKEMVEAMGGTGSSEYQSFRKYCYITFQALRRSAHLLLNLFALMIHSSIPDIAVEQEKSVQKVRDKFHLELSEEEAIRVLQNLIDDSVNAIFAVLLERAHKMAQYFRK